MEVVLAEMRYRGSLDRSVEREELIHLTEIQKVKGYSNTQRMRNWI